MTVPLLYLKTAIRTAEGVQGCCRSAARTCPVGRGGLKTTRPFIPTFKRIKNSRPLQDEAAFNPICTSCFDALRIWAGPAKRLPEITALSTASPSEMCCFRSRNSHPCTSRLPENAWIAACSPSLLHCTKVQSRKPPVPLPLIFAICWHGPQKALLLMRSTPPLLARTSTIVGSSP